MTIRNDRPPRRWPAMMGLALMALLACAAQAGEALVLARNPNFTSAVNGQVLKEIYRQAGLEVRIVTMPGLRSTAEVLAGMIDGEVNRVAEYGQRHPALIRVDPPFNTWTVSAFYKKSMKIDVKTKQDLTGQKLGVVRGLVAVEYLVEGMANVYKTNSSLSLARMLQTDRLEIAVDGANEFKFGLNQSELSALTQVDLMQFPLYHYLSKKNQHLQPVLSRIIKQLSDSGELGRLYLKAEREVLASGIDPAL